MQLKDTTASRTKTRATWPSMLPFRLSANSYDCKIGGIEAHSTFLSFVNKRFFCLSICTRGMGNTRTQSFRNNPSRLTSCIRGKMMDFILFSLGYERVEGGITGTASFV